MNKKVSLKDIAKAVGVSTALVSYVLNNKEKEARVGKEIAEVIRKKAAELNYQPNQLAKSLKSGKSFTVGLIVADISNPFFANIARTIEDEAKKHHYTVIFGSSDENAEKSLDLINVLLKRQVDGFIIAPAEHTEAQVEYLKQSKIPFVLIDRYFPSLVTNSVTTDNYASAYEATRHLLDNGYERIAMLAYNSGLIHMRERIRGYKAAIKGFKQSKLHPIVGEVGYNHLAEEVPEKMSAFFNQEHPVDAIFFATNTLSIHGLKYLNRVNKQVPADTAVVCFDEGDAFDFFYCPLTYVEQPLTQVAKEAVRILIDQVNSGTNEFKTLTLPSQLMVRSSSTRKKR